MEWSNRKVYLDQTKKYIKVPLNWWYLRVSIDETFKNEWKVKKN